MLTFAPFRAAAFFSRGMAAPEFCKAIHELKDNIDTLIVFGALFTVAVCLAWGRILFRILRIELARFEHDLLAGVCGAAMLSGFVFLLCTVKLARTPVFLLMGIAIPFVFRRPARQRFPALPLFWKWLFCAAFVFYALLYLSNSLAPEFSPDGSSYHLGLVAR